MKQKLVLKKTPQTIIVISMRYLGDVLLTTPLIRTLKKAYPNSNIDILVYSHTAAMLEGNPDIHQVITTPQHPKVSDYIILFKKIFRQYDLSIVTQTGDRRFMYGLLSAPLRIGFIPSRSEKGRWKRFFTQGWVEFDNIKNHTILEFFKLSNVLNIPPYYALVPPKATHFISPTHFNITDNYAVIHLHPQWTYKQWNSQGWIKIGEYLKKQGLKIILSGGSGQDEKNYIQHIQLNLPQNTLNLAGKISLANLSHVISHSELFIGPDTGITHLAAATGVPVIALFGPTNPVKWGPWPINYNKPNNPFVTKGSQHINNIFLIQGNGDCVPCYLEGCDRHRLSRSECLDTLTSKKVIPFIDQALKNT
ncbi:MAG: glycosyltransferase family 9 protein [Methylococcales bacterium]|nr:glycosyltransferase family 9 protein [Methylococcales bacterium]